VTHHPKQVKYVLVRKFSRAGFLVVADLVVTESLPWTAAHSLDVSAPDGHRYAKSNDTGISGIFMYLTGQIRIANVALVPSPAR
jgi:hypothetical protein